MKWCCEGLKHSVDNRYERTIFVFSEHTGVVNEKPLFWLGMRSVKNNDLSIFNEQSLNCNVPITLRTRVPIFYCPWCGKKLLKYYKNNYNNLIDNELIKEFTLL